MYTKQLEFKVFACKQSQYLTEKIGKAFGIPLSNVITSTYGEGKF